MEEENVTTKERTEESAPAALGKFKSVDALKHAYEALEAEFTRRSQRLRELEQSKAQEAPAEQAAPEADAAAGQTQASSVPAPGAASGDELYRAVMENEGVRARVLTGYLESLKGVPLLGGTGAPVTAPPVKPRSFAEAGNLALGYLKKNK